MSTHRASLLHSVNVSWDKNKIIFNNCEHFPKSIRGLVCAPSGSGKTYLIINFLIGYCEEHNQDYLDFERLVFIGPSLDIPEYKIIIESFKNGLPKPMIREIFNEQDEVWNYTEAIKELAAEMENKTPVDVQCYDNPQDIPAPQDLNKDRKKTLVIIDDCTVLPQSNIEKYYTYGRPLGIESIFLTQSFFETRKRTIRDQCNLFILFDTSWKDLKNIYDHIAAKYFKTEEDFKEFCDKAWSHKYGYVLINKENNLINMTHEGGYLTLEEYNKKLHQAHIQSRKLLESVRNVRNGQVEFQEVKKEEFKPITDTMKELNKIKTEEAKKVIETNTAMIREVLATRERSFMTLVDTEDGYSFGLLVLLQQKFDEPNFPKIFKGDCIVTFDLDDSRIEVYKAKKGTRSFPLTKDILTILTRNIDTTDTTVIQTYQKIVHHAMGEELQLLKSYTQHKPQRQEIIRILRGQANFRYIADAYKLKGEGYREMSKYIPVGIKPDSDDRFKRYLVLLGSVTSGNTNPEILQEGSAILDSLLKDKKIDKKVYKLLYYKLKVF